jgi:hypothetical protein
LVFGFLSPTKGNSCRTNIERLHSRRWKDSLLSLNGRLPIGLTQRYWLIHFPTLASAGLLFGL